MKFNYIKRPWTNKKIGHVEVGHLEVISNQLMENFSEKKNDTENI